MSEKRVKFSVFTKPWPDKGIEELAAFVKEAGFDGIELPIRPGYQVTPEDFKETLPKFARVFEKQGLSILSVTGTTDNALREELIEVCGDLEIPLIRVMARLDPKKGYRSSELELQDFYKGLVPTLEKNKVKLGIQNHHSYFVGSAIGLVHLLEPVESEAIGYILDPAHCCLAGEPVDLAIGLAWQRMMMVNLKNGFRRRVNGPEAMDVEWKIYWTDGRQGFASWEKIINDLVIREYQGTICLHAEYSDHDIVEELLIRDLNLAKSLFKKALEKK